MVKLRGPMFSLGASGTLADAVTFSINKGRPYVRERVVPSNPKSGAQVGRRAMFTFLSQAWDAILPGWKATYQDIADELVTAPFNAYMKVNMERWHNFLGPAIIWPPGEIQSGSDRLLATAVWEENRIKLSTTAISSNQQWGIIYFAKLAGAVTPAVGNAIIVELDDDMDPRDTFWTPPSVGTWHFNSMTFSEDGVISAAGGAVNAVP